MGAFWGMHVSPAKHSYAWLPRKCDYQTDRHTHRQTPDKVIPMCRYASQATQKCDYQTDRHTHRQTPDKVIPMCRYASQATQKLLSSCLQNCDFYGARFTNNCKNVMTLNLKVILLTISRWYHLFGNFNVKSLIILKWHRLILMWHYLILKWYRLIFQ